jgi:hypothetical protein
LSNAPSEFSLSGGTGAIHSVNVEVSVKLDLWRCSQPLHVQKRHCVIPTQSHMRTTLASTEREG